MRSKLAVAALLLAGCGESGDAGKPAGGSAGNAAAGGSVGASGAGSGGAGAGGSAGLGGGGAGGSAGVSGGGTGGRAPSCNANGGIPGVVDAFLGDSRCSLAFDLCEDFENATLDTGRWEVRTTGDQPEVDATRAARGGRSVHLHTSDNGFSFLRETETFPATNNTYFARAFVWFEAMPTAPTWAHWTISGAVGSGNPSEVRFGGQFDGSTNRFGVGTDLGPTGDWTNLDEDCGPSPVPERQWVCLEWMNDGEHDEGRVWINEVEHPSLHTTASQHGGSSDPYELPTFESAWFGWWLYQAGSTPPEFDLWIDEIVVDGERIGCVD